MIGAIIGDIVGSIYEFNNIKTTEFDFFSKKAYFTDDTVLSVAVADCILNKRDYVEAFRDYGNRYYNKGYGGNFKKWLKVSNPEPYNSWGNGSAMRVSPVGFAYSTLDEVMNYAKKSAEVTHNHPEGIKGAQATAVGIFMARQGKSKSEIRSYINTTFQYDLNRTVKQIRPTYSFNVSCQGTVPEAFIAFLESSSFEDAIRLAISLGGDSDTLACITGGLAQAFYQDIDKDVLQYAKSKLPNDLLEVVETFSAKYHLKM